MTVNRATAVTVIGAGPALDKVEAWLGKLSFGEREIVNLCVRVPMRTGERNVVQRCLPLSEGLQHLARCAVQAAVDDAEMQPTGRTRYSVNVGEMTTRVVFTLETSWATSTEPENLNLYELTLFDPQTKDESKKWVLASSVEDACIAVREHYGEGFVDVVAAEYLDKEILRRDPEEDEDAS